MGRVTGRPTAFLDDGSRDITILEVLTPLGYETGFDRGGDGGGGALFGGFHDFGDLVGGPGRAHGVRDMELEACHDAARVDGVGVEVLRAVAPFDLVGHVDVRRLALAVGRPGIVGPRRVEPVIVRVDPARAVARGGEVDDPGREGGGRRG